MFCPVPAILGLWEACAHMHRVAGAGQDACYEWEAGVKAEGLGSRCRGEAGASSQRKEGLFLHESSSIRPLVYK